MSSYTIVHKSTTSSGYTSAARSKMLKAALAYARKGIPVFPCKPGRKDPLTANGHLDATTDPRKINLWWRRWPRANIGIPTGERSGLLVLDVDAHGFTTLDALEEEHGPIPETATTRTGGGGMHALFEYPADTEVRNSAGKVGLGLDIRGEGGYFIAPPSKTEGPYEWLDRRPASPAPAWLIEAAKSEPGPRGDAEAGPFTPVSVDPDGPPIIESSPGRNVELTRIAGRLHDGTRSLEQLDADLQAINEKRCRPPLPPAEVSKIAKSIHRRTPCGAGPGPSAEVFEVLRGVEAELASRAWPKTGGKSDRDVYVALIKLARKHGQLIPAGVRVSVSIRALALAAATSTRTIQKRLDSLKDAGLVRRDGKGSGTKAGAFVLLRRAEVPHSTTPGGWSSVLPLRAPRLRWSAPYREYVDGGYETTVITRLGKTCGAVIDVLEAAGGSATVAELAEALHVSRLRDFRRRNLARLESRGVVECSGDTVSLVSDWLEALERERELSGEIDAHRRDLARYNRERQAFRNRRKLRTDPAPTEEDLRRMRESGPERRKKAIEDALARLFRERPAYKSRRVGQITCALIMFDALPEDFPEGVPPGGAPKDAEVLAILQEQGLGVVA